MNSKAVIVYVAILVVIAILAFFVLPKTPAKTTTTPPTTANGTTSIPSHNITNSTLPTTSVVVQNYSSCISINPTSQIFNGNFSTGTYAGWSATGSGFEPAPINIAQANKQGSYYSSPWSGYNGTYFASNYKGGLQVVGGNLTSQPFLVNEPYLNFKIISAQSNLMYIQILYNNTPTITTYFNSFKVPGNGANASSTFVNASINLLPLICDKAQIKVYSGTGIVTGGNANLNYIAVAGFYLSKKPVSSPGVIVNQTVNLTH